MEEKEDFYVAVCCDDEENRNKIYDWIAENCPFIYKELDIWESQTQNEEEN